MAAPRRLCALRNNWQCQAHPKCRLEGSLDLSWAPNGRRRPSRVGKTAVAGKWGADMPVRAFLHSYSTSTLRRDAQGFRSRPLLDRRRVPARNDLSHRTPSTTIPDVTRVAGRIITGGGAPCTDDVSGSLPCKSSPSPPASSSRPGRSRHRSPKSPKKCGAKRTPAGFGHFDTGNWAFRSKRFPRLRQANRLIGPCWRTTPRN